MTATIAPTSGALESLHGVPEEQRLGALAFLQVRNLPSAVDVPNARATLPGHAGIEREQLKQWLFELGLTDTFLRDPLRKTMAFKRVTNARAKLSYMLPNGHEVDCRYITVSKNGDRDRHEVHLMRTETDTQSRTATAETQVAQLILYKEGRDSKHRSSGGPALRTAVMTDKLSEYESDIVQAFVKETAKRYRERATYFDADALRKTVREHIESLNAIRLGNGAYFVHQTRARTLASLETLVQRFPEGSSIHIVPMPDVPYQRERLTQAYERQVESQVDSLLEAIAKVNDAGEVTEGAYEKLHARFVDVMSATEEHGRLLERQQHRSGEALSMALKALEQLATKMQER